MWIDAYTHWTTPPPNEIPIAVVCHRRHVTTETKLRQIHSLSVSLSLSPVCPLPSLMLCLGTLSPSLPSWLFRHPGPFAQLCSCLRTKPVLMGNAFCASHLDVKLCCLSLPGPIADTALVHCLDILLGQNHPGEAGNVIIGSQQSTGVSK